MGKRKCGGLSGSDQGMCDAMDVHALAGRPSGRQLGDLPSQDGVRFCARARDGDADEVVLLRCCFMHCAAVFPCSDLRVGSLGGARKDQRKPTPVTGRLPSGLTTLLGGISVLATWELEGPLRVPGRPAHAHAHSDGCCAVARERVHIIGQVFQASRFPSSIAAGARASGPANWRRRRGGGPQSHAPGSVLPPAPPHPL